MKIKNLILLFVLLNLTTQAETYLIIPKNNAAIKGKQFLEKHKSDNFKLLNADQSRQLSAFHNILEVDESLLGKLNKEDYTLVEEVRKLRIEQTDAPNDPQYKDQWSMQNTNAHKAWEYSTGSGVIVAVVDTGIDYEHEDLKDNLWINSAEDINRNGIFEPWSIDSVVNNRTGDFDGIDNDGNGFVDDIIGYDFIDQEIVNYGDYLDPDPDPRDEQDHGTTVSGIIAAKHNNSIGITGAAYNSKIMTLRAFDAGGEGESDDVARCIIYAALNGAQVINMSFGEEFRSPIVSDAIKFAYSLGCVLVSSAGNNNTFRTHYPSDLPEVISVAGTNIDNNKYGFSNYGSYIDISAPGTDVLTTSIGNEYRRVNGTSYSAPFIASAAALLLEKDANLKPSQIKSILQTSSFDLGDNGWDENFGSGIVDMRKALLTNVNSDLFLDPNLFETSFNISENDSISIKGTISIPLMTGFTVFLGKGHYPDRLSNDDRDYIIDSLNTIDSLQALENGTNYTPLKRRNFRDPSQEQIDAFKWDSIFYSDVRFLNEEIFKLPLENKEDTTYTLRFVIDLFNGKKLERRTKVHLFNPDTELKFISSGYRNMLHNGVNSTLVYAQTNKDGVSELKVDDFQKLRNDYSTSNHSIIIDEYQDSGIKNAFLRVNRYNETSATINIPIETDYFEVPRETFKRVSDRIDLLYLFNGTTDYDSDGDPDLLLNDLNSLAIGNSVHYEYEQENFVVKQQLDEAWLPVAYGDTDGDGLLEALTTAGFEFRLFEENEDGSDPFAKVLYSDDASFRWAEGLYDFDEDGNDELILNDEFGYYLVSYKNGEYRQIASAEIPAEYQPLGTERFGVAGDFNGNGVNQLCISNRFGHVMFFDFIQADTARLELKQYFDEFASLSRQFMRAADLDGDGKMEIISLSNGSQGIFEEGNSLDRFWRLRVYKLSGSLFKKHIDKLIYGVQDGLLGNTGISYRNGMTTGDLDGKVGEELVVSTFPNLYVFTYEDKDLKPIWHVPNALSNSAVIYDFNQNGINELGITTFGGFSLFEYDNEIQLNAPTNFRGYPDVDIANLSWSPVENATKYEVFQESEVENNFVRIAESESEEIEIASLDKDRWYRFIIRACNDNFCSEFSANVVEIYPHDPYSLNNTKLIDDRKLQLFYDGLLSFNDPAPDLFELEIDDKIYKPASVTRSTDSSLYLIFNEALPEGNANITAQPFKDFYNGLTLTSEYQFEIDYQEQQEFVYIKDFEVLESSLLNIEFSEEMDTLANIADNFVVEPLGRVLSVSQIPGDSSTVQIFLSSDASYSRGKEYTITAKNLLSKTGKPITTGPGATIAFSFANDLLNNVYMYPHPVTRETDEFYFANLTPSCRVIILSYDGVPLKELIENDGNGGVEWDGTDYQGNRLKSGIYFWKVIDEERGHESALQKMFVK